ncbi:MAG: indolepyruvate ferredoxin oxidoreductase subunit alpha [Peptococcaceae bacterium]
MIKVDVQLCKGCTLCMKECPANAIEIKNKKAVIGQRCVQCGVCLRICKFGAVKQTPENKKETIKCTSCPVQCEIAEGYTGACQRYTNAKGVLIRNRQLVLDAVYQPNNDPSISKPLITAVGAGTAYPCSKPAPHIVKDCVDGVDVVTVVTEVPLSYSGVKVKIDTNFFIGEEGSLVYRDGRIVGLVETEQYGSKMLSIGGANLLTGKDGFIVARTIVDFANGERVRLSVAKKTVLELQQNERPVIDGIEDTKMRVGCGSATIGIFARDMKGVVDEAIILDHHVVGLFSEHLAGAEVGMNWSGIIPNARKSTRGRYFGEHGNGWGGTNILNPRDAIKDVDMNIAKIGLQILVTETTGQKFALFELQKDGTVKEINMTPPVEKLVNHIKDNCEESHVSVIYFGGVGGSARAGVTNKPLALTKAVHAEKAQLTIGGAPAYILPGGGINFLADVNKMVPRAFTWVPTPATVAPAEYTMRLADYETIGGHLDQVKDVNTLKENIRNDHNT